jgi:DNA-binding CsgD family transcriptional regulator
LVGFGGTEAGVEDEGLLPVAAGLPGVADGVTGAETVVGAGLLVGVADLAGQGQRSGVLRAGLISLADGEERLTEAVERVCFPGLVSCLTGQGQGLLVVAGHLRVAALSPKDVAEAGQGIGLTGPVAGLAVQGRGLPVVGGGLLEAALPPVDEAEVSELVRGHPGGGLLTAVILLGAAGARPPPDCSPPWTGWPACAGWRTPASTTGSTSPSRRAAPQGEHAASTALLVQARDLASQLGDETALTYATLFLGNTAAFGADPEAGLALLDEARARLRRSGRWTAPGLLAFTASVQAQSLLGRMDQAVALHDECQAVSESLGESWALSWLNWNLSVGWWAAGDLRNAQRSARHALRLKRALGDQLGIPFCLELLAWVAAAGGEPRRAAVLFGAVEHLWQQIGRPLVAGQALLDWSEQAKARVLGDLGGRAHEAARKQGAMMTWDDVISFALAEKATADGTASAAGPQLTRREQEVAGLVAAGLSNKDIASRLVISQRTAEGHIEHILTKLGFNSRAQIAAWVAGRPGQPGGAPAR